MSAPGFRLYLVTDRKAALGRPLPSLLESALAALPPGAAAVQLRGKELPARAQIELARELLPVCRYFGAPLLVNDRLDVALAAGADGVHLPSNSVSAADARALLGPRALIGVSTHSIEELQALREADFATFGPVFETPSKKGMGAPRGVGALQRAVRESPVPVFALGGIGVENAGQVAAAHPHGLAAIRAFWASPDPAVAARRLYEALQV